MLASKRFCCGITVLIKGHYVLFCSHKVDFFLKITKKILDDTSFMERVKS